MRKGNVERNTKETKISCSINLDGSGNSNISTGIGFFDHMLELFVHHSLVDMTLKTEGDTNVDLHHSVEDTAYAIALATNKAIGDKKGIFVSDRNAENFFQKLDYILDNYQDICSKIKENKLPTKKQFVSELTSHISL